MSLIYLLINRDKKIIRNGDQIMRKYTIIKNKFMAFKKHKVFTFGTFFELFCV